MRNTATAEIRSKNTLHHKSAKRGPSARTLDSCFTVAWLSRHNAIAGMNDVQADLVCTTRLQPMQAVCWQTWCAMRSEREPPWGWVGSGCQSLGECQRRKSASWQEGLAALKAAMSACSRPPLCSRDLVNCSAAVSSAATTGELLHQHVP